MNLYLLFPVPPKYLHVPSLNDVQGILITLSWYYDLCYESKE